MICSPFLCPFQFYAEFPISFLTFDFSPCFSYYLPSISATLWVFQLACRVFLLFAQFFILFIDFSCYWLCFQSYIIIVNRVLQVFHLIYRVLHIFANFSTSFANVLLFTELCLFHHDLLSYSLSFSSN